MARHAGFGASTQLTKADLCGHTIEGLTSQYLSFTIRIIAGWRISVAQAASSREGDERTGPKSGQIRSRGRMLMPQNFDRRGFIKTSAAAAGAVAATALPRAVRAASRPIIDVQVHAYERNHPGRPWAGTLVGPAEMTGDQMVVAMDAVGVEGAVLVSPFSMYRYDASYALEVGAKHPNRFCLVKPVDPNDPAVADIIADWKAKQGTVGVRIIMPNAGPLAGSISRDPADPGINGVLAAAAKHSLVVNLLCTGRLEQVGQLAARNPNTRIVIDHHAVDGADCSTRPARTGN